MNAIVAEAFCEAADTLEREMAQGKEFELAVHDLIKEYMTRHQRIIFNGDGYSKEWVKEAERRGLPNIGSMVEAAGTLTTDKAIRLFEKFGIFNRAELVSREEILYETYAKTINIEALTMINMANKKYIPAVVGYTRTLADTVIAVREAGADAAVQTELLGEVSVQLAAARKALKELESATARAGLVGDARAQAFFYKDTVKAAMDALRAPWTPWKCWWIRRSGPCPPMGNCFLRCRSGGKVSGDVWRNIKARRESGAGRSPVVFMS